MYPRDTPQPQPQVLNKRVPDIQNGQRRKAKRGSTNLGEKCIPAKDFKIDTGQQSEIHGAYITVGNTTVTIFNLYCPSDKDLALHTMNLPHENCLTVGDFNSHSTSLGYEESDRRGDEVEHWQIENNLLLLNDPEDPPTFFSRRWISTSTPYLAFASDDISKITSRKVQNQLAGSDHKPVLLAVNVNYKPSNPKTFPRWNYSKADWIKFATHSLTNCARASNVMILMSTGPVRTSTRPSWKLPTEVYRAALGGTTDYTGQKNYRSSKMKSLIVGNRWNAVQR